MSGKAFGWAKAQACPNRGAKDVLKTLGDYADANGFAYPSVARLALECEASERTIQRDLRALEDAGLLRGFEMVDQRTGRSRTRLYWFPMEGSEPTPKMIKMIEAERGARVTSVSPYQGDASVTGEGDTSVTGRVTTVSPLYEPPLEPSEADASSACARDAVEEAFEEVLAVYPASGIDNTDVPLARAQFAIEAEAVGDPLRLVAAAKSYATAPETQRRQYAAPGLHHWLARQSYRGRLPALAADASPATGPRIRFASDEVRAAMVGAMGEAWVVSWLDPCAWDEGKRVLDPRLGERAKRLGEARPAGVLVGLGVTVGKVG